MPFDLNAGVPAWMWMLTTAISIFLPFALSLMGKASDNLRRDKDPNNDWIADVLDSAREAFGQGRKHEANGMIEALETALKRGTKVTTTQLRDLETLKANR